MSSALGVVARFLAQVDPSFRSKFGGLKPGTGAFTAVWKQIAATEPEQLQTLPHNLSKKSHFDPLVKKIRKDDGWDVTSRSHALQDVIWSTAVQHGGAAKIPHIAFATLDIEPDHPEFDKRMIVAIYAERGRKRTDDRLAHFSRNSLNVQKGVANRFKSEQRDALAMLADGG